MGRKKSHTLLYILILKQILSTSDGRDKVFKIIQYLAKIQIWLSSNNLPLFISKNLSTHFSLFRKMIRLAHVLEPLSDSMELPVWTLTKRDMDAYLERLNIYISIINDLSDDLICLGKIGILPSHWIKRATPISDRCWFLSIWIDLYTTIKSIRQIKADTIEKSEKYKLYYISLGKLLADLMFCTIDVFQWSDFINPGWQTVSGLTAASLGTWKLVIKHSKNITF